MALEAGGAAVVDLGFAFLDRFVLESYGGPRCRRSAWWGRARRESGEDRPGAVDPVYARRPRAPVGRASLARARAAT
jgi:hypothetical protein